MIRVLLYNMLFNRKIRFIITKTNQSMAVLITSISDGTRKKIVQILLLIWGIYMSIIVPINHFIFPIWFYNYLGIPFGDAFDIWAVWMIGAYSIGLGVACLIAAQDPMRYYSTVIEIIIGNIFMIISIIAGIAILGTNPLLWTNWLTPVILIIFCILLILLYPLTPQKYIEKKD